MPPVSFRMSITLFLIPNPILFYPNYDSIVLYHLSGFAPSPLYPSDRKDLLCLQPTSIIMMCCTSCGIAEVDGIQLNNCDECVTNKMMKSDNLEAKVTSVMCCASCFIAEVDDIKLKECDACDLVRYCSDKCQEDHRPNHEAICKERAAELREEILFRQPESSHLGDCPICCLPVPLDEMQSNIETCCSNIICLGCMSANMKHEMDKNLHPRCVFCRRSIFSFYTDEERHKNDLKRVEANDPFAIFKMGMAHYEEGDYERAFESFTKAAVLGDVAVAANAHLRLAILYQNGEGVEQDKAKETYHLEEAAIAGHPQPRKNLAFQEFKSGRVDNAVKHLIIAAKLGDDKSVQALKTCYADGYVSKHDFASALRGYQAAADATKSPQREEAYKVDKLTYLRHAF